MKAFFLSPARVIPTLIFVVGLAVTSANATVTNVVWYRLGENDPGVASAMAAANHDNGLRR